MTRGMIVVDAGFEGSPDPLHFILDSGAGESVLAKVAAEKLGIPVTAGERIRTVSGTGQAGRAGPVRLRLGGPAGGIRFSPRPLVVDLSSESRTLGSRVDGLLGAGFFEGRTIRIDFKRSRLQVSPAGKPGPRATMVPLSCEGGALFVGLTVSDSTLRRVRLDTGCCRSLCWTPPDGRGADTARTADVTLGSLLIADVATDVYRRQLFAGEDGLLGTALLRRFDSVWIDTVNHRIAFEAAGD